MTMPDARHLILSADEEKDAQAALAKYAEALALVEKIEDPISRAKVLQVLAGHNQSRTTSGDLAWARRTEDNGLRLEFHPSHASALQVKMDAAVYDLVQDGYSHAAVADFLGVYKGSVDARVERARARVYAAEMARMRDKADGPDPNISIDRLNLSARSRNALIAAGISTIEQLQAVPAPDIARLRNVGAKSRAEIAAKIAELQGV